MMNELRKSEKKGHWYRNRKILLLTKFGLIFAVIKFGRLTFTMNMNTKRKREDMEIVWQTPANPPERHDYIFRNGNFFSLQFPLYAVFFLQQTFMPFFCFTCAGIRYVKPYYFEFISHVRLLLSLAD